MVRSLIYLVLISSLISWIPVPFYKPYTILMGINVFISATVIQFLIQYILNRFIEGKFQIELREKERLIVAEMSKFEKTVVCPCFEKKTQTVIVVPDTDTDYKCDFCKKDVRVKTDILTVMATNPISELKVPASTIINK